MVCRIGLVVAAVVLAAGCSHKSGQATDAALPDTPAVCVDPATDCPAPAPCTLNMCAPDQTCMPAADGTQDGMSCGTGLVCLRGECISATCGNGTVEPGEQCDFGTSNGAGNGCEADCSFSCANAAACDDANPCNGAETCDPIMVNGGTGQKCGFGTSLSDGTACGTGHICVAAQCVPATCGDGFIEGSETCDDGALNGTPGDGCTGSCAYACVNAASDCGTPPVCEKWTCTSSHTCQAVADSSLDNMSCGMGLVCHSGSCVSQTATCGNGTRESGEQCDDGNTTNLDGCDSSCKFEQLHRINQLAVATAADTYCAKNALGGAIVGSTARTDLKNAIDSGISDGSITIIFGMLGLDDLSGANDASLQVGVLGGSPQAGSGYSGNTDLDWWYTTDPTTIDASRNATTKMPATLAGNVLNAGPQEISFTVNFVGVAVTMDEFGAKLKGTTAGVSTPTASSGSTPGHRAAEHLDGTLTSFGSMTGGELCGNTTAQSLANVIVPSVLVGSICNQNYSTANTLLDVYISGCTAFIISEVRATQPDTSRDGAVYKFTANAQHAVTSCTRNNVAATLSTCLANAGYTSLFTLTTDRVIAK
jgi:cysteine-rich repeat protein